MLVLDASFAVPLFIAGTKSSQARALLNGLKANGHSFLAPSLWIYEVTSALQKLRHFGHISAAEMDSAILAIARFEIELVQPDHSSVIRAVAWSQRLQRASTYDSFYLALAEERGCDLWTADGHLANAVKEKWVRLLA